MKLDFKTLKVGDHIKATCLTTTPNLIPVYGLSGGNSTESGDINYWIVIENSNECFFLRGLDKDAVICIKNNLLDDDSVWYLEPRLLVHDGVRIKFELCPQKELPLFYRIKRQILFLIKYLISQLKSKLK